MNAEKQLEFFHPFTKFVMVGLLDTGRG